MTKTPRRYSFRVLYLREMTMRIGFVVVMTADLRIQPRVPLGRTGSSTCSQPSLRDAVTSTVRSEPSGVRFDRYRMNAPLGALYTVIRWGTGATVATFVDSSDVVVTAMSDGCARPTASLATVDALLPTRAGSAREAAVATVATRRVKVARSTTPTMTPARSADRLTLNSTSRIGTRLRHMGRGQPVDDRLTNGT